MSEPKTPGEMIRVRRQERGLSLAALSESTKIPVRVLEAIERDEYHKVSGALYIKSFLRTCAAQLGLDEAEVMAKYGQFAGEFNPEGAGGDGSWRADDVQISRLGLPWRLIGMVGLSLVIVVFIVMWGLRGCEKQTEQGQTEQEQTKQDQTKPKQRPIEAASEIKPDRSATVTNDSLARSFATVRIAEKKEAAAEPAVLPEVTAKTANNLAEPEVSSLPPSLPGTSGFAFAGDEAREIVLRVVCRDKVQVEMKRDAEVDFSGARWPSLNEWALPLPASEIVAGQVYRVQEGYVVYWGAHDHFSLKLEQTVGVEVSLNDERREIGLLRPGGEMLLDIHGRQN